MDPVLLRGFILLAPQQKLCRITLVGESEMHRGRLLPVWNLDAVSLGAGTITDKRQAVQGKRWSMDRYTIHIMYVTTYYIILYVFKICIFMYISKMIRIYIYDKMGTDLKIWNWRWFSIVVGCTPLQSYQCDICLRSMQIHHVSFISWSWKGSDFKKKCIIFFGLGKLQIAVISMLSEPFFGSKGPDKTHQYCQPFWRFSRWMQELND